MSVEKITLFKESYSIAVQTKSNLHKVVNLNSIVKMFCESDSLCVLKVNEIIKEVEERVDILFQTLLIELTDQYLKDFITYNQFIDRSGFSKLLSERNRDRIV